MKCPYCGKRGAKVQRRLLRPGGTLIRSIIDCTNPKCTAYHPIMHGYHPEMLPEKHACFKKYLQAIRNQ